MKTLAEQTVLLPISVTKVYKLLSKIENYAGLLKAHTKDWTFEGDTCSFIYDGSTLTKLKMFESLKNEKVVLGTFGTNTVNFDMEFLMFKIDRKRTNFKIVIKADLNPIMASMASSSMEELKNDFIQGLKTTLGIESEEQ